MSYKNCLLALGFTLSALATTACTSGSSSSMIQDMKLTTSQVNGDLNVNAIADLQTGGITMLPSAITIVNPKNTSQVLGQLSVLTGLESGSAEIQISVDVNSAIKAGEKIGAGTLPNGTTIPISGINGNNWVTLPIGKLNSFLYLNVDDANKKAVIGVALDIEALAAGLAGDVLLPFDYNNVSGLVGVFTGVLPGTSGIATFIDLSSQMSALGGFGAVSFHQTQHNLELVQSHVEEMQRHSRKIKFH